jgi:hypothetical protein
MTGSSVPPEPSEPTTPAAPDDVETPEPADDDGVNDAERRYGADENPS